METKIKLFNKEYLLIGDMKEGGPIATEEQFQTGKISDYYLKPNGDIWRYNEIVGSIDDIEFLGAEEVEIEIDPDVWLSNLMESLFKEFSKRK